MKKIINKEKEINEVINKEIKDSIKLCSTPVSLLSIMETTSTTSGIMKMKKMNILSLLNPVPRVILRSPICNTCAAIIDCGVF